ncbi:MAG: PAS domain S-box protein [Nitrospirae bacterium]|nr:PAS domain S-box protein [Nitrospirota bacterium]
MKKKIILSLFALLLFFSVGAVLGVVYITGTTSELKRLIELYQVEELRRSLIINIQTVQSNLLTVNTPFASDIDSIVFNVVKLEESANKCSSCHHPQNLVDRIVNMQSIVKDYETELSYFLTTGANADRLLKLKKNAVTLGDKLIEVTEHMSHSATTSLAEKTDVAMSNINYVKIILFATIFVTLLLSILVAIRLINSVTRPINALVNATRMITSGEYGASISYKDKTEFGELANHFNAMSAGIKEAYGNIQKEITERREVEEALRQSEEKFRTFFEMSPTGIIIYPIEASPLNKNLKFATFNSAFHNFLGYTREELAGLSIAEISYPEDMRKNMDLNQEVLEGKSEGYRMEKRYIKKDGELIWGYIHSTALRNSRGETSQIMTIMVDITERKKIEEEQLKIQKLESVGILAGGIAHDFNNIITSIVGNIALAKMSSGIPKNIFEILTDAEEACRRAKDLTSQLLTFSKGGAPIKKIASIAKQLKDAARIVLRGSDVGYEFFIPQDLWAVEIDEGQINQVIFNLIINARQAMLDVGKITISAENVIIDEQSALPLPGRQFIKVTIKDQGIGIPKEHLQNIFDPYFTTKQNGNGLGLSSTYAIIKNHDGYIAVDSEVGKGSSFHIYLPAVGTQLPVTSEKNPVLIEGDGKILLMDDDENILTSVSRTLITIGYKVELAKDGVQAINIYKQAMSSGPFDAVIMDLTIRDGMGGKEAVGKLLEIDPEARVIVSSGYSTDPIMANYKKHGFCSVITKPYQIETLSELLHDVIFNRI